VGAIPALLTEFVALAAMLLAEPVSEETTLAALLWSEARWLETEEVTEFALLCALLSWEAPAPLALERSEDMDDWTLAATELADDSTLEM